MNRITESMDNIKLAQPAIDLILFLRAVTAIMIGMMRRYQKMYPVNKRISHITTTIAIAISPFLRAVFFAIAIESS